MIKLLKKEFLLSMHPTVLMMIFLSAMTLIPSYPYSVIFFYVSMAIFFTCLLGRENNDIVYSLNLPIKKSYIVKSRITFTVIVQLLQMLLMIPFVLLSQAISTVPNQAGMDANISLFGIGFIVYGLFNIVFFTSYYKDVYKVGLSFVKSCIVTFIFVIIEVSSTYAISFVRDYLDTKDPSFMNYKLIFLLICIIIYIILTFISYKKSINNFEKLDIS